MRVPACRAHFRRRGVPSVFNNVELVRKCAGFGAYANSSAIYEGVTVPQCNSIEPSEFRGSHACSGLRVVASSLLLTHDWFPGVVGEFPDEDSSLDSTHVSVIELAIAEMGVAVSRLQ